MRVSRLELKYFSGLLAVIPYDRRRGLFAADKKLFSIPRIGNAFSLGQPGQGEGGKGFQPHLGFLRHRKEYDLLVIQYRDGSVVRAEIGCGDLCPVAAMIMGVGIFPK